MRRRKEVPMKTKLLIAAAAVAAFTTPALADFWIVRDSPRADCRVVYMPAPTPSGT
jgi:hypothetical protein